MWCSLREPGQGGGEGRIRTDRVSGFKSRNLTWFCSSGSTNNKPPRTVFVVQFGSLKRRMWTSAALFLSSAGYNRLRRYVGPLTRFLVLPNVLSSDVYVTASPAWEQAGWKHIVQHFLLSSVRQAHEASSGGDPSRRRTNSRLTPDVLCNVMCVIAWRVSITVQPKAKQTARKEKKTPPSSPHTYGHNHSWCMMGATPVSFVLSLSSFALDHKLWLIERRSEYGRIKPQWDLRQLGPDVEHLQTGHSDSCFFFLRTYKTIFHSLLWRTWR